MHVVCVTISTSSIKELGILQKRSCSPSGLFTSCHTLEYFQKLRKDPNFINVATQGPL